MQPGKHLGACAAGSRLRRARARLLRSSWSCAPCGPMGDRPGRRSTRQPPGMKICGRSTKAAIGRGSHLNRTCCLPNAQGPLYSVPETAAVWPARLVVGLSHVSDLYMIRSVICRDQVCMTCRSQHAPACGSSAPVHRQERVASPCISSVAIHAGTRSCILCVCACSVWILTFT